MKRPKMDPCAGTAADFRWTAIAIGIAASMAALPSGAQDAQRPEDGAEAGDDGAGRVEEVVVTGVRASLNTAQSIKQASGQIVDSIVAEDIGKLPDANVAEALQRISGIQIDRNYGEGSSIAIRGLTQVRTELNGRDVFTANEGRALSFEDVPAELLAGVDVYKNPSADIIEGGLGGTVNLRTRMPFDFEGFKASASAQYRHWDLADDSKPAFSGLVSQRWHTGLGEFGALLNVSYQKNVFRQDTISTEPFWLQDNVVDDNNEGLGDCTDCGPGREVFVPHGGGTNTTLGDRRRIGTALALQWRPSEHTELYAQMMRADYAFQWRDYSYFAYSSSEDMISAEGYPFEFAANGDFISGTFQNVPVGSNTSLTTRDSVTTDYALGMKWDASDRLRLSTDLQYVKATTDSLRYIIGMNSTMPLFHHDIGGLPQMVALPEGYESDPDQYEWGWHLDHQDDNEGDELAWRSDLRYDLDGAVERIEAGVRYADRNAETRSSPWRWMPLFVPTATYDNAWTLNPYTDFFRGRANVFSSVVAASDEILADYEGTLAMFGQTEALGYNADGINTQGEKTLAGYGLARFAFSLGALPVDGNIGLRVVRTEVSADGVMTDPGGSGELLPINVSSAYTSTLPSLNLRAHLSEQLQWRVALSRAVSRPGFDTMSPNLSLNTIEDGNGNVTDRTGSAGNPYLEPMEADQFDTSLEWYFADTGMVYGALFYKSIDGFIANGTFDETYNGETYQVTRPVNGDNGRVRGYELGLQGFADFLPAPFSGLGLQANFTYVDSEAPSPTATDNEGNALTVPLEGLSKRSYNLVGIYEYGPVSLRLAYNWRSDWLVTTAGNGTGNLPIYNESFGQLDASLNYDVTDYFALTLDGVNLTDTERGSYQGNPGRPRDAILNDRRYGITARIRFGD